jgi:AcrR family transcriptional regulator
MPSKPDTRQQILTIAQDLFTEHGYAGTSMADIAGRLGTSKAALYYHFRSKAEIIDSLLAEPTRAYEELAGTAGGRSTTELLAAVVDITASFYSLATVLGNDPSVRVAQRDRLLDRSREINERITAALAGRRPSALTRVRAHAAYAAAKHGTLAVMSAGDGELRPAERAELVAAALRVLRGA